MVRVIVVVKDQDERSELLRNLASVGMDATGVADGAGLYFELLQKGADLVLLERDLKGESGLAVTEKLRATPGLDGIGILLLLPPCEPWQRVAALESGVDICLTRPADAAELRAYARGLARRLDRARRGAGPQPWHFRQSEWKLVSPSGVGIELSHLEAAFIDIIARNAGKPVRRRDIIASAFGKDPLSYDGRRLEALVSRLRKKVYRIYPLSQPIKVVHSIGYVFTDAIRCG